LFISHDLDVVRYISDRVLVMYLGQLIEIGSAQRLFDQPLHPYTQALLQSRPSTDPNHRTESAPLAGDPPNPVNPPSGCRFHTRCAQAQAVCSARMPTFVEHGNGSRVACLAYEPDTGYRANGSGLIMKEPIHG